MLLIYVLDVIELAISQVNVMLQKEQMELILVMIIQAAARARKAAAAREREAAARDIIVDCSPK